MQIILIVATIVQLAAGSNRSNVCKSFWFSNRPSLDCSSLHLTELPPLLPDVVTLSVANNSFVHIASLPRGYSSLQSIRMDECHIKRFDYEAFAQFDQLKELDLSRNQLSKLIFPRNLATLRVLNLAFNALIYVPDMSHLQHLRLVDLSHNRIITVRPRLLPFNLEIVRLAANRFTHLTPWNFLNRLQELDISFNSLQCDCALWHFVSWAESRSLIDSSSLACDQPTALRKSPIDGRVICGPIVETLSPTTSVVSIDERHVMCCSALAAPTPTLFWQHNGRNVSSGIAATHLTDRGRVEFCIELRRITKNDMGNYTCIASLAGVDDRRQFSVEQDKIPIMLNATEGLLIYCQFTICTFIAVCCIISCCVIRTETRKPTSSPKFASVKLPSVKSEVDDDWMQVSTAAIRYWGTASRSSESSHETLCRYHQEYDHKRMAPLAYFDDSSTYMEFTSI